MHEVFEEISQPPVYTGANGLQNIWGWMETSPELNPNDPVATFEQQTRTRELWCAIGQSEIYERILTNPKGFSAVLLSQFSHAFDDLRNRIGDIEQLSDTWTYESFVDTFVKILGDSFSLAQSVLDSIFEQGRYLKNVSEMGLGELTEQERNFLENLAEIRGK